MVGGGEEEGAFERRILAVKAFAATLNSETRGRLLAAFRDGILQARQEILEENKKDVEDAAASSEVSPALLKRLALTDDKLNDMVAGIDAIIKARDPLGQCHLATELNPGLRLYRITVPIGALLVIFEGRPEAFVQIASLCLKTGNVCVLKGGKEATRTNKALHCAYLAGLRQAFDCSDETAKLEKGSVETNGSARTAEFKFDTLAALVQLAQTRQDVAELLKLESCIDLVIPRGGNALVKYIKANTLIPVMGHADGLCHAFADADCASTGERVQAAIRIIRDSKLQYVAACNAVEVLLVHKDAAPQLLPSLGKALASEGVKFKADAAAAALLPAEATEPAKPADFVTEWLAPILAVRVVESVEAAIESINANGSHHTDVILSYTPENVEAFMRGVGSADVFCNCSTRFADGFRFGFGAEVGIATGKLHARGPVGLEGLTTYAYRLYGSGHTVADTEAMKKQNRPAFCHRPLLVTQRQSACDAPLGTADEIDAFERKCL